MKFTSKLPVYIAVLIGAIYFTSSARAVSAGPMLQFATTTQSVQSGSNATVPVNISVGSVETISADAYVLYDPNFLDIVQVTPGTFYSKVFHNLHSQGTLYIGSTPLNTTPGKTGSGVLANIEFRPKQNGTTQIRFDCRGNEVATTSKININPTSPQNVIDCSATAGSVLSLTISGASTTAGTTTSGTTQTVGPPPSTATQGSVAVQQQPVTYTAPTSLPSAGAFDTSIMYTLWGGTLLIAGLVLKKYFPV